MKSKSFHVKHLKFFTIAFLVVFLAFIPKESQAATVGDSIKDKLKLDYVDRTEWFWTEIELVSSESSDSSTAKNVQIDNQGNIHCIWEDYSNYLGCGVDQDIFYKFYNKSTASWSITEVVSTESTAESRIPDLAVDSKGNVHVVWYDGSNYGGSGGDYDIFYKRKNAATGEWIPTIVLSYFSSTVSLGPSIVVDSEDRVHVVWFDFENILGSGTDGDIVYTSLDPETFQWSDIEIVSTESTGNSFYPDITVDNEGNLHVAWGDYSDYLGTGTDSDIFYKRWVKALDYWTTTEVISAHTLNTGDSTNANVAVSYNGTVFIVWKDNSGYFGVGTDLDICWNFWDPITSTWSGSGIFSWGSSDISTDPRICVDYAGELHCVWTDYQDNYDSGPDADIWYSTLDPVAIHSTTPIVLTDNNDDSEIPVIITDDRGFLYMAFSDFSYPEDGGDSDFYLTKLVVTPESPILSEIEPNQINTNSCKLNWTLIRTADNYQIYRYIGNSVSPANLEYYDTSEFTIYTDYFDESGTYSYAIKAINEYGQSIFSNIISVEVNIPRTNHFFNSLDIADFGIIAALVIGVQIIFTTVLYFLLRNKFMAKKTKK